jgi:hypothetical protein
MFILDAATVGAMICQADAPSPVQRPPRRDRGAPYNPTKTKPKTTTTTTTTATTQTPRPSSPTASKADRARPTLPSPADSAGDVTNPAHHSDATNKALPPAPDKTTAPREVDPAGNPRPNPGLVERADQPSTMTDTPVAPPPSEGPVRLDTKGQPGRGIPPAPVPRKTPKTPRDDSRAAPPAPGAPR